MILSLLKFVVFFVIWHNWSFIQGFSFMQNAELAAVRVNPRVGLGWVRLTIMRVLVGWFGLGCVLCGLGWIGFSSLNPRVLQLKDDNPSKK